MKKCCINIHHFWFVMLLGLCSCTGCDIDRTEVLLSRAIASPQVIDLSTGKCLVNEIEGDLSAREKARLTNLMLKQLEEVFNDSIVLINTVPSSRFEGNIPFEIREGQLDTLRKTISYTYLLNVRVTKPGLSLLDGKVNVDLSIFDLDTRNIIYSQRVVASEYQPERNDSGFTFWLGHSEYNLMKNALRDALRDLKRGVRKFNRTQNKD